MLDSLESPSERAVAYARSTIHFRQRRRPPDSGLVDCGRRRGLCAGGVLLLDGFAGTATPSVPPLGLRIYFNLSWGLLVSLYFLMVGYVSKDAPRRAMSARFWIALCFVMPGGIGAVLYFLLRQPEVSRCPACSRTCRATSTSARSATTSSPPVAATASALCAPPTSSAPAAAMSWPRTICRRGCG